MGFYVQYTILHVKLDDDGGPELGVDGACTTDDRLLVNPISEPLLKPKLIMH